MRVEVHKSCIRTHVLFAQVQDAFPGTPSVLRGTRIGNLQYGLSEEIQVIRTGCQDSAPKAIVIVQPDGFLLRRAGEGCRVSGPGTFPQRPAGEKAHVHAASEKSPVPAAGKRFPSSASRSSVVLRTAEPLIPNASTTISRWMVTTALIKALKEMSPERSSKKSSVPVCGGARRRIPHRIKWETCRKAALHRGVEPVTVCNATREIPAPSWTGALSKAIRHAVLEGMIIGARAIGCREDSSIYGMNTRLPANASRRRIEQAPRLRAAGTEHTRYRDGFHIEVVQGAGAFVCGESTALMASLEGKVGEPRPSTSTRSNTGTRTSRRT